MCPASEPYCPTAAAAFVLGPAFPHGRRCRGSGPARKIARGTHAITAKAPTWSSRRVRGGAHGRNNSPNHPPGAIRAPAQLKTFGAKQQQHKHSNKRDGGPASDRLDNADLACEQDPMLSATTLALDKCPALVLNADFQPLSYLPLSLWPWQEAVKAVYSDRVNIVATYDVMVRSPSVIFPLPSVISLKHYQKSNARPPFSRFNLFLRDHFSCQYCAVQLPTTELTFDHIVPRCLGGKTTWTNVVAACCNCNHRKGRRLLRDVRDLRLVKVPVEPTTMSLQNSARLFPPRGTLHESWRDYIYWNESMADDL